MPKQLPNFRAEGSSPRNTRVRYDNSPARAADKRFYASAAWRRLRESFLREYPMCVMCDAQGYARVANHVDHVEPRKSRPDRALDPTNLQGLCQPCHNKKRAEE